MAPKQQANWSPDDNNGGTYVAIAGSDYCVMAADTRMSTGYRILTRDYSKTSKLSETIALNYADVKALQKNLAARHLIYQHQHNKQMSCPAMAQLLSNTLYYKRFFPYYAFNVLGGLDNEGKDAVTPLSESEAVDLVEDVFASAMERDIYTGDRVEIVVINAEGIQREFTELRKY
ncbi:proteasome subunit beta type-1 [Cinnamomum micranthum f. kanehirae]|uniref:Proteasome subunit beta type-1 n=1 Tax=Cinnamomum micranthum f. kanehirae TaxID=337451 RepID=A0A3S3MW81_9MAGN|nr:proteasome subunit beta type-1 [Cinnamomum micranthum f. kanehirae]